MSRNRSPLCRTLPFFATVAVMAITASGANSLLLHRWSFNNDFTDSAGGQTATATNYSFVAHGGGYAVKMQGGASGTSFVDLGKDILPNDGSSFTLELWARLDTWASTECRVFNIGKDVNYFFCQTWGAQYAAHGDFLGFRDTKTTYTQAEDSLALFNQGVFFHLAYVFTPSENGRWLVRGYKRNPLTGAAGYASFLAPAAWSPTSLVGTDCWLGRWFDTSLADAAATYDEVRVWKRALSEREIAASCAAGPDAAIGSGEAPFGGVVYDTAKGLISPSVGKTFADGMEKMSAHALYLSGDTVASAQVAAYDGTVVQSGGSFSSEVASVVTGVGKYGLASFAATGGAELNVRGMFGNGSGELLLNDATLRFQGNSATPELVHRWSFNGDLNDSVGGLAAVTTGCSFVEVGAGGAIKVSGGGLKTSYVELGQNTVPADGNGVTIELWARVDDNSIQNARILDFGGDKSSDILLCWREVIANTDLVIARKAGFPQQLTRNELSPYRAGVMYHIALVISKNGDGTWGVRAYKHDAATGTLLKSTAFAAPTGWTLSGLVQNHTYLGRPFDGDNTPDSHATYDEVRIWKGILTEEQLAASAIAGPDALYGGGMNADTATIAGLKAVKVGGAGAVIDTNGKDVSLEAPLASLASGLVHRWSFNGDMEDSVGGQTAQNVNGQYVALGGGQAVKLPEDGSGRIDLGSNAMPIGDAGATIELWARNDVHKDWARMFDFGNDGWHSFMVCWADYAGSKNDYVIIRNGNGTQTLTYSQLAPFTPGTEYYIAATFSRNASGAWTMRVYKYDLATGRIEKTTALAPPSGWTPASTVQTHCYLGYALDGSKTAATYDEVRIYDHALTEAELIASASAGPDADLIGSAFVKTGAGTLSMSAENTLSGPMRVTAGTLKARSPESISRNSAIELGAGTILDLGGNSVTAAGLTGGGAIVSNGTLSVTGAICPTGEIVLDGADVSGTLEVSAGSGMLRCINGAMDLTGIVLDVKSAAVGGQVVIECADGFTGDFADVNVFSKSYVVRKKETVVKIAKRGLAIIVK